MVLQPEEPKISLSGIDHFARGALDFESSEGVTLFPELRIVSTITREVEPEAEAEAETEGEDDPTGMANRSGNNMGALISTSHIHADNVGIPYPAIIVSHKPRGMPSKKAGITSPQLGPRYYWEKDF